MPKNKYYVVWKGKTPGIYNSWDSCKVEIEGFAGALYKGYPDYPSAQAAFEKGPSAMQADSKPLTLDIAATNPAEQPITQSIAVDAACSGNPGKMEYKMVFVETKTELYTSPVYEHGTNNIGEFLAIVHALSYQKKYNLHYPIYSDSVNAQKWVRQKHCNTKLQPDAKNQVLFELIQRAETWLANNTIDVPILKWKTEIWGEIPADFGRK